MLIPILSGTLPGWPDSGNTPWLLLLAIMFGIPLLCLAFAWVLGSGRAWRTASPELAGVPTAELARVSHADDVAAMEVADETTPDGPNRVVADRRPGTEKDVAPEREVKEL